MITRAGVGARGFLAAGVTRTLLAFTLPFLLYLLNLAPTIYNLDSAELTTAAATGGIVRATGYPLYLALGKLWSLIPIGDVGFRLNLLSAAGGALTIALSERILNRWKIGPWATFGALGLLATAPFFWSLSLVAEVYTLHTALMALVVLLLLRWADKPTAGRLAATSLVIGLSLGHHAATVLLLPGVTWFVLTRAPRQALHWRSIPYSAVALLAGLSIYLYLPYLHSTQPAFNYAGIYDSMGVFHSINLQTLEGLWWLLSGKSFAAQMFAYRGPELWHEIAWFGGQLWRAFLGIGIGPGLLGAYLMLRRDWRVGSMLLFMFLVSTAFYIDYRVVDKETMFLPSYVIWALWLGAGYQGLLDWVRENFKRQTQAWQYQLLGVILAVAVLFSAGWDWTHASLAGDWSTRTKGEQILAKAEPEALIFGWWDTVPVIEYLQLVEKQRPDVTAINRFLISQEDLETLIMDRVDHQPIYIDSPVQALLKDFSFRPAGQLYQVVER